MIDIQGLVLEILHDSDLAWYDRIPDAATRPIGRVTDAGGPPQPSSNAPDRLTFGDLQFTAWGTTLIEAKAHLFEAVELLHATPRAHPTWETGTLVRVVAGSPFDLEDPEWPIDGRPGPRYEMTVRIVAHG